MHGKARDGPSFPRKESKPQKGDSWQFFFYWQNKPLRDFPYCTEQFSFQSYVQTSIGTAPTLNLLKQQATRRLKYTDLWEKKQMTWRILRRVYLVRAISDGLRKMDSMKDQMSLFQEMWGHKIVNNDSAETAPFISGAVHPGRPQPRDSGAILLCQAIHVSYWFLLLYNLFYQHRQYITMTFIGEYIELSSVCFLI